MDVTCRMELRHEERIHVPEFRLHERASHFLESHAHEFCLHDIEKLTVGMPFARRNPWRAKTDRVFTEALRPPAPVFQQFRRQLGDLFRGPLPRELLGGFDAGRRKLECSGYPIIDAERFPCISRV